MCVYLCVYIYEESKLISRLIMCVNKLIYIYVDREYDISIATQFIDLYRDDLRVNLACIIIIYVDEFAAVSYDSDSAGITLI